MSDNSEVLVSTDGTQVGPNDVFEDIRKEAEEGPIQLESYCVNCEKNGTTKMLLTKIPHFREVIIVGFECPHCGFRNQEIQFGGTYKEHGIKKTLQAKKDTNDLNRQVIKSDNATITIPELEFEIPTGTQKGSLNTIEGVLQRSIEGLSEKQALRKVMQPDVYEKVQSVISGLTEMVQGKRDFTLILDDPSGNSNIQNFLVPKNDPQLKFEKYTRSKEQNRALGLGLTAEEVEKKDDEDSKKTSEELEKEKLEESESKKLPQTTISTSIATSEKDFDSFFKKVNATDQREIVKLPEPCHNCGVDGFLNVCPTNIPYFKEIILMAFSCDNCGYRTNEVKAGGAIPKKGKKITFKVTCLDDMSRDVLKSETASLEIPEVELEVTRGSMGGRFTTVEGLLQSLKDVFLEINHFEFGDSAESNRTSDIKAFLDKLDELKKGEKEFTLIIDDPVSNSYLQNYYAPDPDPNLKIEEYTRSEIQDEELGITDMKVENYES